MLSKIKPPKAVTGCYSNHFASFNVARKAVTVGISFTAAKVFQFAEEIHGLDLNEDDILVSYDVSAC